MPEKKKHHKTQRERREDRIPTKAEQKAAALRAANRWATREPGACCSVAGKLEQPAGPNRRERRRREALIRRVMKQQARDARILSKREESKALQAAAAARAAEALKGAPKTGLLNHIRGKIGGLTRKAA